MHQTHQTISKEALALLKFQKQARLGNTLGDMSDLEAL